MHNSFRVRFAPSPTGPLHIGGVRTALYNYLLAKKHKGAFVLRIEDTDQKRYVLDAESYIREALDWLGLYPDEGPEIGGEFGPYRQSERRDIYKPYVQELIDKGKAYYAFDTPESLDKARDIASKDGDTFKYDASVRMHMQNSLSLDAAEVAKRLANAAYTIRMKVDPGSEVSFDDAVRGKVTFKTKELDDKVIMKADGLPTYHMANIVDDHLMQISHVVRGEEWISSTAHHVLLYRALDWEDSMPTFAHLPLILKPEGKGKLSKRDGAKFGIPVFPLKWTQGADVFDGFRESGYLPEAVLNFLAFLGWNPGTEQEMFNASELIEAFSLEQVGKSGARFDKRKAQWYNAQYIQKTETTALFPLVKPLFEKEDIPINDDLITAIIEMFKARVDNLNGFVTESSFLYGNIGSMDEKAVRKKWKKEGPVHFDTLSQQLIASSYTADVLKTEVEKYVAEAGVGYGAVLPLIRLAVSGKSRGPDLFTILELLGREKCQSRFETAPETFNKIIELQNA